jgi:CubicO group peptidase (beta-lactamase class C family)
MKYFFLTLIMVPYLVKAQTIAQKADELLTAYSDQHKFSGNVLIAKEGKIIFQRSYGYADIKTKKLNTATTEFRAGSLTKMFTSTAILQLAESGKLSLTDPVIKYVPNFAYGDSVKIINLLSHTSGIKGYTASPEPNTLQSLWTGLNTNRLPLHPVPGSNTLISIIFSLASSLRKHQKFHSRNWSRHEYSPGRA